MYNMTLDTFESCIMPLIHRIALQMNEKGYLVEGDAEGFVQVLVHRSGGSLGKCPLSHIKNKGIEVMKQENNIATMTIGDHPENVIAHLFKNIYSELIALERAKKSDSLYVRHKVFA